MFSRCVDMGPRAASTSLASFTAASAAGLRVPATSYTSSLCQFQASKCFFFHLTLEFLSATSSHAWRTWRICSGSTKLTSTWTWVVDDSLWRRSLSRLLLKNTVKKSHEVFVYGGSKNEPFSISQFDPIQNLNLDLNACLVWRTLATCFTIYVTSVFVCVKSGLC